MTIVMILLLPGHILLPAEGFGFVRIKITQTGYLPLTETGSFTLLLLHSGRLIMRIGGKPLQLSDNSMVLIREKTRIRILDHSVLPVLYMVTFSMEFLLNNTLTSFPLRFTSHLITGSYTRLQIKRKDFRILITLAKIVVMKIKGGKTTVPLAFSLLLMEIELSCNNPLRRTTVVSGNSKKTTLLFFRLLYRNFHKEHSVSFYARSMGYTADHLSRILRKNTGKTANYFIITILIAEARIRLFTSNRDITSIAGELGFGSPEAFNLFFRRHTGISPIQYRKNFPFKL